MPGCGAWAADCNPEQLRRDLLAASARVLAATVRASLLRAQPDSAKRLIDSIHDKWRAGG